MYILANMWFTTLMREFFFGLDKIVFNFIPTIYNLLIEIARTSILSQKDIAQIADRIYDLLTVFMIFKVTFSLIMYVVNPDDFTDKTKGVSKLGTNIVISLALLVLTPYIFSYAYQLQTIILEDNSLATLVFGEDKENKQDDNNEKNTQSNFNSAGEDMAFIVLSPFFVPDTSLENLYECSQLMDGKYINEKCFGLDKKTFKTNIDFDNCKDGSNKQEDGSNTNLICLTKSNDKFTEQSLKNYAAGLSKQNVGLFFREDIAIATDPKNKNYVINYKWGISTVVGVITLLLLITFCMDVALRSIKLTFLQLIAPIPIISYIDPKSGKDGLFKKWYQMCFSTYLSLFIRLLALYFGVYIISKINNMTDIINGSYVSNAFVKIFVVIGVLMFIKKLPDILKDLGIKLDSNSFTLNPFKKMENDMLGGKQALKYGKSAIGATAATGAGLLVGTAGAIGNVRSRWNSTDKKDRWKLLAGGLTSGLSTGLRAGRKGAAGVFRGEKGLKNFTNSYKQAREGEKSRMDRLSDGVGLGSVMLADTQKALGIRTRGENVEIASKKYESANEKYKAAKDNILAADDDAKNLNEQLKVLEATTIDRKDFYKPGTKELDEDAYNKALQSLIAQKKAVNDKIDERVNDIMTGKASVMSGGNELTTNTRYVQSLNEQMQEEGYTANDMAHAIDGEFVGAVLGDNAKKTAKSSQTASSAIKATDAARKATNVDKYTKNGNNK